MEYYKDGTVQITAELTLKDFTWKIKGTCYNWETHKAIIEVVMWENHYTHSRSFAFDCEGEWSSTDCINSILSLDHFTDSKEI